MIFSLSFFKRSGNLDTWEVVCLQYFSIFILFIFVFKVVAQTYNSTDFLFIDPSLFNSLNILLNVYRKQLSFLRNFFFGLQVIKIT